MSEVEVSGFFLVGASLLPEEAPCRCQPRVSQALLTRYVDMGGPVATLVGKCAHPAPVFCTVIHRPLLSAREHVQHTVGYWQPLAGKGALAPAKRKENKPS